LIVRFPRNRKVIAGVSIGVTAALFTGAIFVSHIKFTMPIFAVFVGSVFFSCFLFTWGAVEAIKQKALGSPTRV